MNKLNRRNRVYWSDQQLACGLERAYSRPMRHFPRREREPKTSRAGIDPVLVIAFAQLLAMLVLGTALPHALRDIGAQLPWQHIDVLWILVPGPLVGLAGYFWLAAPVGKKT